jgi:TolB-like protein/class 3 adenylate cyclase/Tfp pilus assembly protein PilF
MTEHRQLAAIMFTDIVGYSALMSKDEKRAMEVLEKNREIHKTAISQFNGQYIKEIGDGTLSIFKSSFDAVRCAVEIQEACCTEKDFKVRIGIHIGDVIFQDNDVFGDGVNIASRIESSGEPGRIYISERVYDDIQNKSDIKAEFVGEKRLKNIEKPVKIFALVDRESGMPMVKPFKFRKGNKPLLIAGLIMIILSVTFALTYIFTSDTTDNGIQTIAVLPFVDMSPDKDQEYFCDGMAEEIINALSHLSGLQVVARTSAFSFKDKNINIKDIGKELDVDYILEGSVRKSGDDLRVSAQLVNVKDGYQLWSEKYKRSFQDIFSIQDDISLAIVDNMKIELLSGERNELVKRYTENQAAYNLYLEGRYHWNQRDEAGFNMALQLFMEAIELDSTYALAYSGLAECYSMLSIHLAKPEHTIRLGKIAAERALALDETLAEAHTALGWFKFTYDWDWLGAERSFKRAIQLNPRYATVYNWYAVLLSVLDRHDEAIQLMEQARDLDPKSSIINRDLGIVYAWAGDFEKAIQQLQYTIKLNPAFIPTYFLMGVVYSGMKKYDLAIEYYLKSRDMSGGFHDIIGGLGFAYAKTGREDEALLELKKLEALVNDTIGRATEFVMIYSALGETDKAFEWLGISCDNHEFAVLVTVACEADIWLNDIIHDPRFDEVLSRLGLKEYQ